jgi:hypothetical protein
MSTVGQIPPPGLFPLFRPVTDFDLCDDGTGPKVDATFQLKHDAEPAMRCESGS